MRHRAVLKTLGSGIMRLGRQQRLIVDAVVLGVAGAAAAQVFTYLLRGANWLFLERLAGYRPPGLPDEGGVLREVIGPHGLWLVPVVVALGGLIVGFLVQRLAPETEGHGTDTVVQAFHRADGVLRARVTPIKLLGSAITIGSGGSAGREGPIALAAAGLGSWYASAMGRTGAERRLLLLVGMAAGIAAIFRSPVGAALFAIEVLYADMEFESGALLLAMLASVVAYAINGFFVGWRPLFRVPGHLTLPQPLDNGWYLVLGVGAGVVATIMPVVFYGTRDGFRWLKLPPEWKPALGGLLMGALALLCPQVIGGGYGWMQEAIDGRLAVVTLLTLVFAKPLAMSLTISSGGSGGVFAPTLFVGAMLGGLLASLTPPAGGALRDRRDGGRVRRSRPRPRGEPDDGHRDDRGVHPARSGGARRHGQLPGAAAPGGALQVPEPLRSPGADTRRFASAPLRAPENRASHPQGAPGAQSGGRGTG